MDSIMKYLSGTDNSVQARPSASIDMISDKELLSIFSRLPLRDLFLSVELVSHRWRWLALICCSNRKSLALLQAPAYREQLVDITRYWFFTDYSTWYPFEWECIRVSKEVTSTEIERFGTRFPKVTNVTLYCLDNLSLERFVELIKLYPKLENLTLFSTHTQQILYNQPPFWNAIQGLNSLSHLHLSFEFGSENLNPNQLACFVRPRIQTLFCKFTGRHAELRPMTRMLEPVAQLGFHVVLGGTDLFLLVDRTKPIVLNDQVQLPVTGQGLYQLAQMVTNTAYAPVITHLDLAIQANVSLLAILPNLVRMTQLSHIRFRVPTDQPSLIQPPNHFFTGITHQNYRNLIGQPVNQSIPSVRNLTLTNFSLIQPSSIFRYFSLIFPQIHSLNIEDCTVEDITGTRTSSYWFLTNVRRFAQLRQLYHNNRLMLKMNRDKDGDHAESAKLVQVITDEIFKQRQ